MSAYNPSKVLFSTTKIIGKVKSFDPTKGTGIIHVTHYNTEMFNVTSKYKLPSHETGFDVCVNINNIVDNQRLVENQYVEFYLGTIDGEKERHALDVSVIDGTMYANRPDVLRRTPNPNAMSWELSDGTEIIDQNGNKHVYVSVQRKKESEPEYILANLKKTFVEKMNAMKTHAYHRNYSLEIVEDRLNTVKTDFDNTCHKILALFKELNIENDPNEVYVDKYM